MPDRKIWVVKIGGSLAGSPALKPWLHRLVLCGGGWVIVVPGGGPFADQVRSIQNLCDFDDRVAHAMALHAMDQYGLMCCGLEPGLIPVRSCEALHDTLLDNKVALWLPEKMMSGETAIAASWDMTSDSIAAWLARQMGAIHLLLIKYQPPAEKLSASALQAAGVVDRGFANMVDNASFSWSLMDKDDYANFYPNFAQGVTETG